MVPMTMERICLLDVVRGTCEEARDFFRQLRLATVFHEDNAISLRTMARKLKIPLEEFSAYVWLQAYIRELSQSYDDLPSPANVAQQFGISLEEFENYLQQRARLLYEDGHPWQDAAREDLGLDDLLEDGGRSGLAD